MNGSSPTGPGSQLPAGGASRAAVLRGGGDSVRGVFDDRFPMLFLPHGSADLELAIRVGAHDDAVVSWSDDHARFDAPVAVTAVDRKRGELILRMRGPVARVQRRRDPRVATTLPCTLVDFGAEGVTTAAGSTINLSSGGAALVTDRSVRTAVGSSVGMVLELPARRVGAVAEVVAARRRSARTELRLRFSELHPADSAALTDLLAPECPFDADGRHAPNRPGG